MAYLQMGSNAYLFSQEIIEKNVPDNCFGNYALGYKNEQTGVFIVLYVGRSDTNLRKRLLDHLGEDKRFKHFKFIKQVDIRQAYLLECKNYHDFGGEDGKLLNKVHPDCPSGYAINCPICALKQKISK